MSEATNTTNPNLAEWCVTVPACNRAYVICLGATIATFAGPDAAAHAALFAGARELREAFLAYVDWCGPEHEDDCPGDDTCDCRFKPISEMINAVLAKTEAVRK